MRFVQQVKTEDRVKLDLKDKRILALLGQNARLPVTAIAKKVDLSRDAISHRIRMYSQKGLIQGYKTIVDIKRLGFDNYHVFLQLNKPPKEEEKKLLETLAAFPFVRAILKFSGKYDLELALIARSLEEFDAILEKVLAACTSYLLDYEVLLITKTYRTGPFPRNFLEADERPPAPKPFPSYPLDATDFAILKLLANDARIQLYQVAQKVRLSPDAVTYRLKKLLRAGFILSFIPAINYEMLGYGVYAILMKMRLTEKKDATLRTFFQTDKNILWAVKALGKYNTLFYISTPDPNEVHATLHHLRSYFPEHITEYETLLASEEYKYTYLPEAVLST